MSRRQLTASLAIFTILAAMLAACAGDDDTSEAPPGDGTAPSPSADDAPGNDATPSPPAADDAVPPAEPRQILFF